MRERENFMKRQKENEIECKHEAAARQLINETNVSNAILSFPDEAHNRERKWLSEKRGKFKRKTFFGEASFLQSDFTTTLKLDSNLRNDIFLDQIIKSNKDESIKNYFRKEQHQSTDEMYVFIMPPDAVIIIIEN